jgi:hypothetical protein
MKFIGFAILALVLTGCASTHFVSFSPSPDYAVSVQAALFDAVRTDTNDATLFRNGKTIGFIKIEPVPTGAISASEFLETLESATESENLSTRPLNMSSGFSGFSAKNREYLTGYLLRDNNPYSILVISFPEDEFDEIAATISPGI